MTHPGAFQVASAIRDRLHTIYQLEQQPGMELREAVAMVKMVDRFGIPTSWLRRAVNEAQMATSDDAVRRLGAEQEAA